MTVKELCNKLGEPQLNVEVRDTFGHSVYHGKAANVLEPVRDWNARRVVLVVEVERPEPAPVAQG